MNLWPKFEVLKISAAPETHLRVVSSYGEQFTYLLVRPLWLSSQAKGGSSGGFKGGKGGANAPPLAASSIFLRT